MSYITIAIIGGLFTLSAFTLLLYHEKSALAYNILSATTNCLERMKYNLGKNVDTWADKKNVELPISNSSDFSVTINFEQELYNDWTADKYDRISCDLVVDMKIDNRDIEDLDIITDLVRKKCLLILCLSDSDVIYKKDKILDTVYQNLKNNVKLSSLRLMNYDIHNIESHVVKANTSRYDMENKIRNYA